MKYTIEELMKILDNGSKGIPARRPNKLERFYMDNEIVDRDYLKILNKILLVYLVLARHANAKNQGCFLTYETIMEEIGKTNRNTLSSSLKILVTLNMIIIKHFKGTRCNFYYLVDSSKWKPANSINFDTIISVSKCVKKQYQNSPNNSIEGGTINQRIKSTNKIKENNHFKNDKTPDSTEKRTAEEQEKTKIELEKIRKWGQEKLGWPKK